KGSDPLKQGVRPLYQTEPRTNAAAETETTRCPQGPGLTRAPERTGRRRCCPMRRPKADVFQVLQARPKIVGVRVGSIVAVRPRGKVLVDFPGNPFGPVVARQTASVTQEDLTRAAEREEKVLLTFENNDPGSPIIFDVV